MKWFEKEFFPRYFTYTFSGGFVISRENFTSKGKTCDLKSSLELFYFSLSRKEVSYRLNTTPILQARKFTFFLGCKKVIFSRYSRVFILTLFVFSLKEVRNTYITLEQKIRAKNHDVSGISIPRKIPRKTLLYNVVVFHLR